MTLSRKDFIKYLSLGTASAAVSISPLFPKTPEDVRPAAPRMKIRDIEIYALNIPMKKSFAIAQGTQTTLDNVLIRIQTDVGITGLGESSPARLITGETQDSNIASCRAIKSLLLGKDPLAVESCLGDIGVIAHSEPSIVAAVDMALFDIMGKAAGLPLYRLLGGDKVAFETDITVFLDTPEVMAREAAGYVQEGFGTLKVKTGRASDVDVAAIRMIREAVGPDVRIRIDANQGWTPAQASGVLKLLESSGLQLCEQPVAAWDVSGLRSVRDKSLIPIMADEALFSPADALRLVREEACDLFNIKLMKSGGILRALKIAHIAEAANIRCMVGCMTEGRIGLTAGAHLVASQRNIIYADLDALIVHGVDPVIGGMTFSRGKITMPETPGLGLEIDPAFLKSLKRVG